MEGEIREFFSRFMSEVAAFHDFCQGRSPSILDEIRNDPTRIQEIINREPDYDDAERAQNEIDSRWKKICKQYFTDEYTYEKRSYSFVPRFDSQIITEVKPKGPRGKRHIVYTEQDVATGGTLYFKYEVVGTDRISNCWTLDIDDNWTSHQI